MKKYITVLFLALAMLIMLPSCQKEDAKPEETKGNTDWRNSIEYEASFFVNSETKLLYALDKGKITLWDNKGNGEALQVLEYSSAEAGAIESIETRDIDLDGSLDIINLYSENDNGMKYNLWLWSSELGKYQECKLYRSINDPVVSEDGTTVTGTEDKGDFGIVETVYTFGEAASLTETSKEVINSDEIAQRICADIIGSESGDTVLTKTEGTAFIDDIVCTVYAPATQQSQIAYIACSPNANWYIDDGCRGVYRLVDCAEGKYSKGVYTGKAGEITEVCAQLYGCQVSSLSIGGTSLGSLCALDYSDAGIPILPDPENLPEGIDVTGYYFYLDGQSLCHILIAENGALYCFDPDLTGDSFFHLISASGETAIVPETACEFYPAE